MSDIDAHQSDDFDKFEAVYSISDLHLSTSGRGASTRDLTKLMEILLASPKRSALVLNGDVVDFLDFADAVHFDPSGSHRRLAHCFKECCSFWEALDQFSKKHTVVITLGNHDLELALPQCRALLRRRISGRLVLALDGSGYRCKVGSTNLLFVHGNNQDPWNWVDVERLARVAACVNADRPWPEWRPNQGTKLVIEVLNREKVAHPFIDYLKPEGPWLVALLEKLGHASWFDLAARLAPRITVAKIGAGVERADEYLSAAGSDEDWGAERDVDADDLLLSSHAKSLGGARVLLQQPASDGHLGVFARRADSDEEICRFILDNLVGQEANFAAYANEGPDEIWDALRTQVGQAIDAVVCGHTHLRRAKVHAAPIYYNTGTWMPLMDLRHAVIADRRAVLAALRCTSVSELRQMTWRDAEGVERPILTVRPTVFAAESSSRGTTTRLMQLDTAQTPPRLQCLEGTEHLMTRTH